MTGFVISMLSFPRSLSADGCFLRFFPSNLTEWTCGEIALMLSHVNVILFYCVNSPLVLCGMDGNL